MNLLDRIGQGILDIEGGRVLPPSPEGLAIAASCCERRVPAAIEECGEDLIAYVLTFQDQRLPMESAIQCWREEWSL